MNHPLIDEEVANSLIENVIAQGALPVDLLPNIIVDDKAYVVPKGMVGRVLQLSLQLKLRGAKLVNQDWRICKRYLPERIGDRSNRL